MYYRQKASASLSKNSDEKQKEMEKNNKKNGNRKAFYVTCKRSNAEASAEQAPTFNMEGTWKISKKLQEGTWKILAWYGGPEGNLSF